MAARLVELQYRKYSLRAVVSAEGTWISVADIALILGYDSPKNLLSRLPAHERSTEQMLKGPRVQVVSPAGVERIAGSSRKDGALKFLDWFQGEGMPQLALALQDEVSSGVGSLVAVDTEAPKAEPDRTFLYGPMQVRTQMDQDGEILFRGDDVCQALELSNPWKAVADHVDPEDLTKREALTPGGPQQVNYVNLSGLYALVFGSKKDAARKFKRWVTHDVLPSIQKTGGYSLNDSPILSGGQTPAQQLGAMATQAALAAALPGAPDSRDIQIQARQALAVIDQATRALSALRLTIDFRLGLDRPTPKAELPDGLDQRAADKVMTGRHYILSFRGAGHPHLRPIMSGEHLVKADLRGVKFLANQGVLSEGDWLDLEKLAQFKARVLRNKAD
jgi:prophage antirepressor-like protein